MRPVIRSSQAVITAVAAVLALGLQAAPAGAARALPAGGVQAACPQPTAAGMTTCATLVSDAAAGGTGAQASTSTSTTPSGYAPANLQAAYGVQAPTVGMRQTVAVVEAGGDPNAASDLATYRSQYGLAPCTIGDGCLRIVSQTGGSTLPPVDTGFTSQTAVDLEMVSAVCPNCHILLVEANDAFITDLGAAVNEAVTLGAKIVNVSYGGPEPQDATQEASWDASFFSHPGVAITAAAGNVGYTGNGVYYPAASPDVISVGGTTLDKAGAAGCTASQAGIRGWCETAWNQTTSGCSLWEPKPAWQGATNCAGRADNDLAAVASSTASPGAPIAYFFTPPGQTGTWAEVGGTGAAAPIIAGIYADAGTPGAADNPAAYPYQHPGGSYINPGTAYPYFSGLHDITSGTTGTCNISDLCTAGPGWDAPTGLGSPAATVSLTPTGTLTGTIKGDQIAKCLDDYQGIQADDNKIQIYTCNGDSHSQNWTVQADGTIHIGSSGYCIGVSGGKTADGTKVILFHCDGATSQQWQVRFNGELLNQNSGKCLEDPSNGINLTQLVIDTCSDSYGQQWTIPYPVPTGTGEIKSQADTSKCLDNQGGKLSAGNKIQIYDCNGGADSQTWTLAADGTIRIGSSWCLTADGALSPFFLEQCAAGGAPSQFFVVASNGSLNNYSDSGPNATPGYPGSDICVDATSMTNGTVLSASAVNDGCDSVSERWELPSP